MQVVAIVLSLLVTVVTLPLITAAVRDMVKVMRAGNPVVGRRDNPARRTVNMLIETFGHTRMLQRRWVAIMHWFVYAAFILLSTAVLQSYFQIFNAEFAWPLIGHFYPYEWLSEALGLLSTIGIIYLIAVRQWNHPRRLERDSRFFGSRFWQAYFVEVMAMLEGAAILFIRGAEYRLIDVEGAENGGRGHFPIASYLGDALYGSAGEDGLKNIIFFVAMFKIVLAMVWLAVIARNLTMGIAWHRFTAWPNIWFKRRSDGGTALGGLQPIIIKGKPINLETMEDLEEEDFEKLGVGQIEDFTWKGILDFSTCTECGRCQSQCPAWNTEKPLSPKLLVMGLREHAYNKIPLLEIPEDERTEEQIKELERPLIGNEEAYGVIDPDVLWSCTNCGACVQQCPVDIEHVDHIEDMRRFQVLVESNFPAELNNIFKGLERKGNPWGMDPKTRMDWAKNLDFPVKQVGVDVESLDEVDWLFWVGCAGAFEDRAKKTTQAVAELLNIAGVDFAVLGDGETCTGDPARRAGNEIVFMQLAMENAEVFKETKAKKVVSTCAHCFNTLKNEYAEFGVELEVVHHTQLLNRLVREGKLKPVAPPEGEASKKITYHDPCFLGRHNQVYEPPRELLQVIPGAEFTEMPRNSEKSFCCGAGGARMWMEENLGSRINVNRTEEAIATGADQIAVGCPFCRVMLSDGLTLKQSEGAAREEVEVLDVAQMLLASIKRDTAPAAKATQAEPDVEDEADPDSISETAKAAEIVAPEEDATTGQSVDELDSPDSDNSKEAAEAAAENNVEVDDNGTASDAKADEPADDRAASDKDEAAWTNVGAVNTDDAPAEKAEGTDDAPAEATNETDDAPAETEAAESDDREASAKEDAAWANVGPVATDAAEAEAPAAPPEPVQESEEAPAEQVTHVPDEAEPVEQEARDEEVEASGEITAVEDAPTDEPGEDIAELSDANPSGEDLSGTATDIVPGSDDETKP